MNEYGGGDFDTFKQLLHALNGANAEIAELEGELAAKQQELTALGADAAVLKTKESLFFKLSRWVDGDNKLLLQDDEEESDDANDSSSPPPIHVGAGTEGSGTFDTTFAQLSEAKQRVWRLKRALGRKSRGCEAAAVDISTLRSRIALDGSGSGESKQVTVLVNGQVVKMTRDDARCAARDKALRGASGGGARGGGDGGRGGGGGGGGGTEARPRQSRIDRVKTAVAGAQLDVVTHLRDVLTVASQSAEEFTVEVGSGSCVCFEFEVQQPDGADFLRVDVGFKLQQQRAPLVRWTDEELKRELAHAVRHRQYAVAASVAGVLERKHRSAHSKLERAVAEGDYETAARLARYLDGRAEQLASSEAASASSTASGLLASVASVVGSGDAADTATDAPSDVDELIDVTWEGMRQPPSGGEGTGVRYGENEAVNGFWGPARHPTTLHFCFDNEYSLMRDKVVALEVMVLADQGSCPVQRPAEAPTAGEALPSSTSQEVDGQLTLQGIATNCFSVAKQRKVRTALAAATQTGVESVRLLPASASPAPELGVKVRFVITADSLQRAESLRAELQLPNFVQKFSQQLQETNSGKARRASRQATAAKNE